MYTNAKNILNEVGQKQIAEFNKAHEIPIYACPNCGEKDMIQDPLVLLTTFPPKLDSVSFTCRGCDFRYIVKAEGQQEETMCGNKCMLCGREKQQKGIWTYRLCSACEQRLYGWIEPYKKHMAGCENAIHELVYRYKRQ